MLGGTIFCFRAWSYGKLRGFGGLTRNLSEVVFVTYRRELQFWVLWWKFLATPVPSHGCTGSFDCVRLAPHSAQDDSYLWVGRGVGDCVELFVFQIHALHLFSIEGTRAAAAEDG